MANNFKTTGNRVPIDSASADLVGGQIAIQEGFLGIVDHSIKSGVAGTMLLAGVFNVPVPASQPKGTVLYAPYADLLTDEAAVALSTSASSHVKFGTMVSASDANNFADVRITPQ